VAVRNIAGQVSDRHGIPLLHALRLDVTALDSVTPTTADSVLAVVDGELVLSLISDLPTGSGVTIFDILSGNAILTVSQPDISAANVTLTVDQTQIDHDALLNFVADEHVAHSGVTLTAGVGLSGGGTIALSRTFDIDWTELTEDTSPDEAADFVATYDTSAAAHKKVKFSNVDHDNLTNGAGNKHIDHTAVVLTAGVALSGGGDISASRTFDLDITELVEDTNPDEAADFLVTYDTSAAAHKKVKPGNIDHNNLTNFVANKHIDHTAVTLTAGVGLSGGGDISASRTFDIDITELTEDTSPDEAADFLITYDTSAATHKKVKPDNIQPNVTNATGTLPISKGGTGQTTQTAAMDALSPTSVKGDLLVDNGTNVVKLGVGSNGQVVVADSSASEGLKWGNPALGTSAWTTIIKTADVQITSDNTLNNDADLLFTTVANTNYMIRMLFIFDTQATPDFQWDVTHSGTTTSEVANIWRIIQSGTVFSNIASIANLTTGGGRALLGGAVADIVHVIHFLRVGASGGTWQFRWAQNTSDVGATIVRAGSFVEYIAHAP